MLLHRAALMLLVAGCSAQGPLLPGTRPVPVPVVDGPSYPLEIKGNFVVDAQGRALLLRGMNYSGLEFGNLIGAAHGPGEADFEQMRGWGANVVRVAFGWSYLEPRPGVWDDGYFEKHLDPVVAWAGKYGLSVILELHQFFWSPCLGGNGAPAWICEGHSYEKSAKGAYDAQQDFWAGGLAPDGRTLQSHLEDCWRRVARRYKDTPHVVGFDFMNEPADLWNNTTFEAKALNPFNARMVALLEEEGARQLAVLEPAVLRNTGVRAHLQPVPGRRVLYAPHLYTGTSGMPDLKYSLNAQEVRDDHGQALVEAKEADAVLWVGEYGGSTERAGGFLDATTRYLRDVLDEQDRRLLGGAAWAYFPGDNVFSVVDAWGVEKGGLIDAWSRPYPQQTAGVPRRLSYDATRRTLEFEFEEADTAAPVPDPTVLYLPLQRHFRDGVRWETSPGLRAELDEASSTLRLYRDPAELTHMVRVFP